jgi:4-hydroxybenzoate polyprenyltransferase
MPSQNLKGIIHEGFLYLNKWVLQFNVYKCILKDKYDDMLIGVKSTALKFGDKTKHWLSGFGTIMIGGLTYTGIANILYLCVTLIYSTCI